MRPDVIDLHEFYDRPIGRVAIRHIARQLRLLWPNLRGLSVLGFGYAVPYLIPFVTEAERVLAFMPAGQGVNRWPDIGLSRTALSDEFDLPLADASIDRVLLVHELENCEQIMPSLRELWRILTPNGRILVVVPNRRGLWARFEHTPFGQGHPFTAMQLTRQLRENQFLPMQSAAALFWPPGEWGFLLRGADALEGLGLRLGLRFPGVLMIEACKQIYAATNERARQRLRRFAPTPVLPLRPAVRMASVNDPGAAGTALVAPEDYQGRQKKF